MAQYVKVVRSIWSNPDFIALNMSTQRAYFMLISQPDITHAGVLPLTERRWANLAADTDPAMLLAELEVLEAEQFIVCDRDTDEVWVRSYMRYDEMFKVPNGQKAIDKALEQILSTGIRRAAVDALAELIDVPSSNPFGKGSGKGSREGCATPAASTSPSTTTTPAAAAEPGDSDKAAAAVDNSDFATNVIDAIIGIRLQSDRNVRNPTRYRAALKRDLPDEHGERIAQLHDEYPTAAASLVAGALVSGDMRQLAPHRRTA